MTLKLQSAVLLILIIGQPGCCEQEWQTGNQTTSYERMNQDPVQLVGLKWSNCGKTSSVVTFTSLTVSPDPILLGETLSISTSINVSEYLGQSSQQIKADVALKLKIEDKYTDLCPLLAYGICHTGDLCERLKLVTKNCPKIIQKEGLNCTCPFKKNVYKLSDISVVLPVLPFEIIGSFDLTARLTKQKRELACIDVKFCIKKCN